MERRSWNVEELAAGAANGEPQDEGTHDDSDGRSNRSQVFALLLVDSKEELWLVPYGYVLPGKAGKYQANSFLFSFQCGDKRADVQLTANPAHMAEFMGIVDKLASGKREYIRPRQIISSVTVTLTDED